MEDGRHLSIRSVVLTTPTQALATGTMVLGPLTLMEVGDTADGAVVINAVLNYAVKFF